MPRLRQPRLSACLRYITSRRSLYKPLLGWLFVRCWVGFLPKCRLLGFPWLLLVRRTLSCHMPLFVTAEASPFFPIAGFVFFCVGLTNEGKAWFVYIHRDVGSGVFIRVSASSLAISSQRRRIPLIFLRSQHNCFLVGSLIFDLGCFFPSSHISGLCFPIEDLCKQSSI